MDTGPRARFFYLENRTKFSLFVTKKTNFNMKYSWFFRKMNIIYRYSFFLKLVVWPPRCMRECPTAVRQTRKCLTEICQTWQLGLESRLTQLIAAFLLISPLQEVERWTLTHWKVVHGFQRFLPENPGPLTASGRPGTGAVPKWLKGTVC